MPIDRTTSKVLATALMSCTVHMPPWGNTCSEASSKYHWYSACICVCVISHCGSSPQQLLCELIESSLGGLGEYGDGVVTVNQYVRTDGLT